MDEHGLLASSPILEPRPSISLADDSQSGQIDEEYGKDPKTLAAASRNLLSHVLKTAGFPWEEQSDDSAPYKHQARVLLDLGFGCGDQTVYLMSPKWVRKSDQMWWGCGIRVPCFNSYTGITLDSRQFAYAQERVRELRTCKFESAEDYIHGIQNTRLFHADAARPAEWNDELRNHVIATFNQVEDGWVLALDTLYHFSPSRWQVIEFTSRTLNASLMAFDLCLSERISLTSLLLLRITTVLMGAPWANFVTQDQYHAKLIEAGYQEITITDISEHVFAPLAAFMEEQDRTLRVLGFGLGPFHLARWMFRWWAQTGIVRGIVVIAKR